MSIPSPRASNASVMAQPWDQISLLEREIEGMRLSPPAIELTPLLLVNPSRRTSYQTSLASALATSDSCITRLREICAKINKLATVFEAHQSAIQYAQAPVSALPPEIIGSIILYATLASPTTVIMRDTCRLSHVCSSWRHAALSHATLWSRVDLTALMVPDSRIETWLSRTASVPLHLQVVPLPLKLRGIPQPSLRGSYSSGSTDGGVGARYISQLQPRIHQLDVFGPFLPSSASFESLRVFRLWMARINFDTLQVSGHNGPPSPPPFLLSQAYRAPLRDIRMPNLEHLECGNMKLYGVTEGLFAPKLSYLSLSDGECSPSWVNMFKAYPNLESLHLRRIFHRRANLEAIPTIRHEVTSLRDMTISGCRDLTVLYLFGEIDFSHLETFKFAFNPSYIMYDITDAPEDTVIEERISEAICSLTSLTTLHLSGTYRNIAFTLDHLTRKINANSPSSSLILSNMHTLIINLPTSQGIPPLETWSIRVLLLGFITVWASMGSPPRRLSALNVTVEVLPDGASQAWFNDHIEKLETVPVGLVSDGIATPDWAR